MLVSTGMLLGNLLTASVVWAIIQFNRKDFRAPWTAYIAFALPIVLLMFAVQVSGGSPDHWYAEHLQRPAEQSVRP